jgi:hypothetical protein
VASASSTLSVSSQLDARRSHRPIASTVPLFVVPSGVAHFGFWTSSTVAVFIGTIRYPRLMACGAWLSRSTRKTTYPAQPERGVVWASSSPTSVDSNFWKIIASLEFPV